MSSENSLSNKIRDGLEGLLSEKVSQARALSKKRGPNSSKIRLLYQQMPLVHEALEVSTQSEILETLRESGLDTSRPTLRRVYKKWTSENQKVPRMKFGVKKKTNKVDRSKILSKLQDKQI